MSILNLLYSLSGSLKCSSLIFDLSQGCFCCYHSRSLWHNCKIQTVIWSLESLMRWYQKSFCHAWLHVQWESTETFMLQCAEWHHRVHKLWNLWSYVCCSLQFCCEQKVGTKSQHKILCSTWEVCYRHWACFGKLTVMRQWVIYNVLSGTGASKAEECPWKMTSNLESLPWVSPP